MPFSTFMRNMLQSMLLHVNKTLNIIILVDTEEPSLGKYFINYNPIEYRACKGTRRNTSAILES